LSSWNLSIPNTLKDRVCSSTETPAELCSRLESEGVKCSTYPQKVDTSFPPNEVQI